MSPTTNHLVAFAKKLAAPAAVVGAFALGAAIFVGHGKRSKPQRRWTTTASRRLHRSIMPWRQLPRA